MVFFHAYRRWLWAQEAPTIGKAPPPAPTGWLWQEPALGAAREPGHTVVAALKHAESWPNMGTTAKPVNASDRCGGVMRIAPVGFWPYDHSAQYSYSLLHSESEDAPQRV